MSGLTLLGTLSRYRDSGRGLFAELELKFAQNGSPPQIITTVDLNLKAPRSRDDLARRLQKRSQGLTEKQLDEIVEQICVLGIRLWRQGEPVIELSDDTPARAASFRLNPLVYDGHPTVAHADGGSGKTYLGIFAFHLVEKGLQHAGFSGVAGNALFLDWETDKNDVGYRRQCLQRGHPSLAGVRMRYRRCFLPLADDIKPSNGT